jgi:sensor histidine kinase YesM
MLDHLIAYLRGTLGASRATMHPLQTEFDRLRDYLALMSVRMGPRLSYTLDLPQALGQQPVPPLLLQPLVENSIRHGLEPKVAGGHVSISARLNGQMLTLTVTDTGTGLTESGQGSGAAGAKGVECEVGVEGGFGLGQVRERLHTCYGDLATFEIADQPSGGTCVSITLPASFASPP